MRLLPDRLLAIGQGEEPACHPLAGEDRQRHVVEQRQLVEEVDDLEAARDAGLDAGVHVLFRDVLAAEADLPAVGQDQPADQVHQAGLPGAVGADQREDLAFADGEVDFVDGVGVAEVLGQLGGLEEIHLASRLLATA